MSLSIEEKEKVLKVIERNPGIICRDLAAKLGYSRSNVAYKIKTLEELGLVEKRKNPGRHNGTSIFVTSGKPIKRVDIEGPKERILRLIKRHYPISQKALVEITGYHAGNIKKWLVKLTEKKLVQFTAFGGEYIYEPFGTTFISRNEKIKSIIYNVLVEQPGQTLKDLSKNLPSFDQMDINQNIKRLYNEMKITRKLDSNAEYRYYEADFFLNGGKEVTGKKRVSKRRKQ